MKKMRMTEQERELFEPIFLKKENQNCQIKLNGKTYEYCTAMNNLREIKQQGTTTVGILIGFYIGKKLMIVTY